MRVCLSARRHVFAKLSVHIAFNIERTYESGESRSYLTREVQYPSQGREINFTARKVPMADNRRQVTRAGSLAR